MTIIVQGMGIPEGCFVCPLKKFNSNDLNYYCPYIKDKAKVSSYLPGSRRHPDCPCKEVPTPHGRLIDEKWIKEYITDTIKGFEEMNRSDLQNYSLIAGLRTVEVMIEHAPTVIEAEE